VEQVRSPRRIPGMRRRSRKTHGRRCGAEHHSTPQDILRWNAGIHDTRVRACAPWVNASSRLDRRDARDVQAISRPPA
jgi:hypothetical protein